MDEPDVGEKRSEVVQAASESAGLFLECPRCRAVLDPGDHGNLVFDGPVWCDKCHAYDRELIRPREFKEIESWSRLICAAFGFSPVPLEISDDPAVFRLKSSVLMAEADHGQKSVRFYPPGCRLTTLCHELAHIHTGHGHTRVWAGLFAVLVAWVKFRLDTGQGVAGYPARQPISAGVPRRVY
ncbi:MAG: hypothetical protein C4567_08045 [Deltaproteobacteria bacterium]|nr:MAG: hypothetical protein C4567_08045 [Deltaproteobacteria bacterium]